LNLRFKVESHSGAMECTLLILHVGRPMQAADLQALRRQLRRQRQRILRHQRNRCQQRVVAFLKHWWYLAHCRKVACYLAVEGEFPTDSIIRLLQSLGKAVYLPLLTRAGENRLIFQKIGPGEPMIRNRFGIPEPAPSRRHQISPEGLDLVITPLVGFGKNGARLGMGGGFYDRSFAFTKGRRPPMRPFMLGLGYSLQEVDGLEPAPWDVPMDAILTENGWVRS